MNYEEIIGGMTDADMREMLVRLLDHMKMDEQVDVLEENLDEQVMEELYSRWSDTIEAEDEEAEEEAEAEEEDEDEDEDEDEVEEEKKPV